MASSKRATCHSCTKPIKLCLCTRIKNHNLNNSISITILQHSLELNHPLNSTRIAALGLRNLKIVPVFDVHFEARFCIWPLWTDSEAGFDCFDERINGSIERTVLEKSGLGVSNVGVVAGSVDVPLFLSDSEAGLGCFEERNNVSKEKSVLEKSGLGVSNVGAVAGSFDYPSVLSNSESGLASFQETSGRLIENSGLGSFQEMSDESIEKSGLGVKNLDIVPNLAAVQSNADIGFDCFKENSNGFDEKSGLERSPFTFTISKKGVISPDFGRLFRSPVVLDALAEGFIVKKWQNKSVNGSITHEQFEEFEIVVPPGSALLFPSENSVGIEAIDFEVKNLIVLDGTWAKAKRIYSENPWLKALPHLRLDLDKLSLYSEVRRQPRAGYLSTLESIVYALKGLGEESDGLYQLLEVFESMIGDQRRCKDERLMNFSESGSIDTHSAKHIPALDNF